jgi:hypothetical protein
MPRKNTAAKVVGVQGNINDKRVTDLIEYSDVSSTDTSSSKKVSNILPPSVVEGNPYFEIKQKCKGLDYEPSIFMPKLTGITKLTGIINDVKTNKTNDKTNGANEENSLVEMHSESILSQPEIDVSNLVEQGPVHVGLKADISIVKVRKTAWETLAAALVNYAKEIKLELELEQTKKTPTEPKITEPNITETGIYKYETNDKKKVIKLFVQKNQNTKTNSKIEASFNLTVLGQVFVGANVDEPEEHSGGAPLIRQTMTDKNSDMKNVDEAMLKIISILFLMMNIGN